MTDVNVLSAMQDMLYYVLMGVFIVTLPVLIVGLIFSVIQAATQINEMTITFIPKFITMFVLLFLLAPWMMGQLIHFLDKYMMNLHEYIR